MSSALQDLGRRILGPDIAVVAGRVEDLQGPLWPGEMTLSNATVPSRLRDFTAGRTAARNALAKLGRPQAPIPREAPSGAPVWPEGVVGSISHALGHCIVIAGRQSNFETLGVDIEGHDAAPQELATEICLPAEAARLRPETDDLTRIFSAKEAFYKAQYPLSKVLIGFDAVEIRLLDGGFEAIWRRDCGRFSAGDTMYGHQAVAGGLVLSALALHR